jgi:hypothetical protein
MESAVRVLAVDYVLAFGRFLIACFCLSTDRITAQRDLVSFENLAVIEQRERARALHDHQAVGFRCRTLVLLSVAQLAAHSARIIRTQTLFLSRFRCAMQQFSMASKGWMAPDERFPARG